VTADLDARPVDRPVDLRRLPIGALLVAATVPLVLLAVLTVVLLSRAPLASPSAVGAAAPDFALADLDGNTIRLEDLRGRPVIVNFWASWCGPCVEEFPLLREAAERHAGHGLAIVGIVYQDRSEAARDFMRRNGGTWPAAMDPGDRVAGAYGILGPPETFFIGRDGTIVARQLGQISAASLDEKIAAIIDDGE
jgi:cytochrome c biogenesis protein CcmG/thiol:disulfide interchange protein DsbE